MMKSKRQKQQEALARTEDSWQQQTRMRPNWRPSPGALRNVDRLRFKLDEPPRVLFSEEG